MLEQKSFRELVDIQIKTEYGKTIQNAKEQELWTAISRVVIQLCAVHWEQTQHKYSEGKQAHYFSAEFLVGRSLSNNLIQLDLYEETKKLCEELGFRLEDIEEVEIDPGLGNGGLGRLAACFLDSCACLDLPVTGYGILYRYGLFKQEFDFGFQKEKPDKWMEVSYPFMIRKDEDKCIVDFKDFSVWAIPYDMPIVGYQTSNVNTLRLWQPEALEDFDFDLFNAQNFPEAVRVKDEVEDINRVLYPNDTVYEGKVLRVRQQYFFTSASLQHIIKQYRKSYGDDFSKFAENNKIQLNDTHPVVAIPELLRLLMDVYDVPWEEAWLVTKNTFAYTNHTIMVEAMEKWDITIFQNILPRIYEVIEKINSQFWMELQAKSWDESCIAPLAPIYNNQIHMVNLATYMVFSVNGVAQVHTNILKTRALKSFYELWPEKFNNKTNGISIRRWLNVANPLLSEFLTKKIGSDAWMKDLLKLKEISHLGNDQTVLKELQEIKNNNKIKLAQHILEHEGIKIDPNSIFDVQVKRIHEYKRQLLNIFVVLDQYFRVKENPELIQTPVTYIFGGKAAPGYFRAKACIKFINEVAKKINEDESIGGKIKVVFLTNYNVSYAEKVFPAADVSEQISTVGYEASGTGNMKFMLNGALTFGTMDGANIEIVEEVGDKNCYIFGVRVEDFVSTISYYEPNWQYHNIPGLKKVIDTLIDGTFSDAGSGMFQDLYNGLIKGMDNYTSDQYYVLGDFNDMRLCRERLQKDYLDRDEWNKKCWINICNSGKFSSDRTIMEYAEDIWKITAEKI